MKPTQLTLGLPDRSAGATPAYPECPLTLPFTGAESEAAFEEWRATCGPHAIAAATGISLDEVRESLSDYRGFMSPTQVEASLTVLGLPFRRTAHLRTKALCGGLNRIQWEGPWLNPGVPAAVAYKHTHWVAHRNGWVLCTAVTEPPTWIPLLAWCTGLEELNFPWHITHHYELASAPLPLPAL
jgi:hypothetical protein